MDTTLPAICFIFCILHAPEPVAVNNYATECRVINPSKRDTAETLKQVARENARCRAAKGGKK